MANDQLASTTQEKTDAPTATGTPADNGGTEGGAGSLARNLVAGAALVGGASALAYEAIRRLRQRGPARSYRYYRQVFDGRPMPFAYVDLDALRTNISRVLDATGNKSIRIGSKSVRSVAMLKLLLNADPRIRGVLAYNAPEAVYLAENGIEDIVIAYPTWHPDHVEEVANALRRGRSITLMVDSLDHVRHLEGIAARLDVNLPLCIDLDVSSDYPGGRFGVWRSPLRTTRQAINLIDFIEQAGHVYLDGIMGYEAQIAGIPDDLPGQWFNNFRLRTLKRQSMREVMTQRAEVLAVLQTSGVLLRFFNGGGSGSLRATTKDRTVTEITVGSAFYAPHLFDNYKEVSFEPAAGYAIEIVRRPAHDIFTCNGGGYVASGGAGKNKLPQPYLPDGAFLLDVEGAGEVQTPVRYLGPERLALGDPVFMRHAKAGELCEHFNTLLLVSDGKIVDEVTTYRGDGQAFG